MIPEWVNEHVGLLFVLPLIFAAGFLVLAIIPTLASAYAMMALLVDIGLGIIAFDVFALGIYGILRLIDEYCDS